MIVCGIDPGFNGAISFLDGDKLTVYGMPLITETFIKEGKKKTRSLINLAELVRIFREHKPTHIWIERVSARPGQGGTSMFRFGQGYGEVRGVAASFDLTINDILPQAWKKVYGLTSAKIDSLDKARELWPEHAKTYFKLKKQDGWAEAAIIALYGRELLKKADADAVS